MRILHFDRKPLTYLVLLFCGASLGIALAYWIARTIQLGEGREEVRNYAERLVRFGDQIDEEDSKAVAAVTQDNLPFCSDQELAFMRDYVFRSPHIRDIGRTKNGMLYCSTGIGRLKLPGRMPAPDFAGGGWKVYVRIPVKISARTMGFVAELDSVSMVLDPDAPSSFNEPPKSFTTLLLDLPNHRMIHTFGPTTPLTVDEIVAGRMIERGGVFYQPRCSLNSIICEVAFESRADILATRGPFFVGFLVGGALLCSSVAALLIVLYNIKRSLESQLRRAIRRGKLALVYQPVVDLETRTIFGAEALVRWVDDSGEDVAPDVFVSLAEQHGFVGEITRLVVRKALHELSDLLASGTFRLTLNIAAEDLVDCRFFAQLEQSLRDAKVNPSTVGLELTERSTADQEVAIQAIRALKTAGHAIYIDDFGTGYSSLSYLHRLAADAIKIDQVFTQTVGTDSVLVSVVPQILEMANELDLMVVVEGIETFEQAEYFRKAGAGIQGQGWLFGKPVSAAQLVALVQEKSKSICQPA